MEISPTVSSQFFSPFSSKICLLRADVLVVVVVAAKLNFPPIFLFFNTLKEKKNKGNFSLLSSLGSKPIIITIIIKVIFFLYKKKKS